MTGTKELLNMAALMRIFAETARKIADVRVQDKADIYALSARTEELADAFDAIGRRPDNGADLN